MSFWMNIGQIQKLNAKKFKDTVALMDQDRSFTYPAMNQTGQSAGPQLDGPGTSKGRQGCRLPGKLH